MIESLRRLRKERKMNSRHLAQAFYACIFPVLNYFSKYKLCLFFLILKYFIHELIVTVKTEITIILIQILLSKKKFHHF